MFSPLVVMDTTTKLHSDLRLRQNDVKLNNTIAINVYHEGNDSNVVYYHRPAASLLSLTS